MKGSLMHHRLFLVFIFWVVFPSLTNAVLLPTQNSVSFAPIVKKAAPAVVSISTTQATNTSSPLFGNDPFFNFFFGSQGASPSLPMEQNFAKSLGSGVIVDSSGIVITCGHVVKNAEKILITLSDNREFEGKILMKDLQNDLVAIQLNGVTQNSLLPVLPLEENDVEVGDVILAIGNPFGVGQTVTSGIISAIARNVRGRMLMQTDAPINPGNSGGALISMNGNLVGIPNAILSKTGSSHGIGFAVPEGLIRTLLSSIYNGGAIIRPWAGIDVQRLTGVMAQALGLHTPQGVLVKSFHSQSPALAAGLQRGDVITGVNGLTISTPEEFIYRIQTIPLEEQISLNFLRNNQFQTVSFFPMPPPAIPAPDKRLITQMGELLNGLEVANLSPALISQYGLPIGTPERGVVITEVGHPMW